MVIASITVQDSPLFTNYCLIFVPSPKYDEALFDAVPVISMSN